MKEIFTAHYGKTFMEKEILYYNCIERDVYFTKKGKELKHEQGHLISPRPKQKFGTDKLMAKIDEFLVHEQEADYFQIPTPRLPYPPASPHRLIPLKAICL